MEPLVQDARRQRQQELRRVVHPPDHPAIDRTSIETAYAADSLHVSSPWVAALQVQVEMIDA